MKFEFWKYHALGNHFVIVDVAQCDFLWTPTLAKNVCNPFRGVGGDGVLLLSASEQADFRMVIYNADGSRPEMCGNGLRCFARYLFEQGVTTKRSFTVETDRGVLSCEVQGEGQDIERIRVEMGAPLLERKQIGILEGNEKERCLNETISCDGERLQITAVSMGNPHMILFDWTKEQQLRLAPQLEEHSLFPNKTNVEFVTIKSPTELDVIVYERGCGYTEACGTGACAVAVAAIVTERIPYHKEVTVRLPGGSLGIEVEPDLKNVWLLGSAAPIFSGHWCALEE